MGARASLICVLVPAMLCLAVGCGDHSAAKLHSVTGTVTLDGEPLPQGDIHFDGTADGLGIDSARIKNGKYALRAKAGRKKVQIVASREVPGKENAGIPGTPVYEEYIPEKYNTKSDLSAEVKEGGENAFPFELKSK